MVSLRTWVGLMTISKVLSNFRKNVSKYVLKMNNCAIVNYVKQVHDVYVKQRQQLLHQIMPKLKN